MTEAEFISALNALSIEQLNELHQKIEQRAKARTAPRAASAIKSAPRRSEIDKMADALGLDLRGLMRDIAKR